MTTTHTEHTQPTPYDCHIGWQILNRHLSAREADRIVQEGNAKKKEEMKRLLMSYIKT